jgi:hypothetical protein
MNSKTVLNKILTLLSLKSEANFTDAQDAEGSIFQSPNFDLGEDIVEVAEDGTTTPAADGIYTISFTSPEGEDITADVEVVDGKIHEISAAGEAEAEGETEAEPTEMADETIEEIPQQIQADPVNVPQTVKGIIAKGTLKAGKVDEKTVDHADYTHTTREDGKDLIDRLAEEEKTTDKTSDKTTTAPKGKVKKDAGQPAAPAKKANPLFDDQSEGADSEDEGQEMSDEKTVNDGAATKTADTEGGDLIDRIETLQARLDEMSKVIAKWEAMNPPVDSEVTDEEAGVKMSAEDEELPKLDGAPIDSKPNFNFSENKKNYGKKATDSQSSFLAKLYK